MTNEAWHPTTEFTDHYRWIDYPENLDPELKAQYERLADYLIAQADQPICVVWAKSGEDWRDSNGVNPPRDCLLVTEHIRNGEEWTFGSNLSSHIIHKT